MNEKEIQKRLIKFDIELPSWGFGRGGTRFALYNTGNEPLTIEEKINNAAKFYKLTVKGKKIALHFPWDGYTDDEILKLKKQLKNARLKAGSINSNLFNARKNGPLDSRIRFGSFISPIKEIRNASIEHNLRCIDIMRELESKTLVIWLPDGTNSPGQMSFYDQFKRVRECLSKIHRKLKKDETMLIEYKLFEPAFYSTAIQDWGHAFILTSELGLNAKVLVDIGHHAPTVNIEHIIAILLQKGKLGGLHFNDKKYADDDLAAGSIDPAQLFRIFCTIIEAEQKKIIALDEIAFMIDQSHCVKDPFNELIESLDNIETAYAKSCLVDFNKLHKYQNECGLSAADYLLKSAFLTDVRPILKRARHDQNIKGDFSELIKESIVSK